MSLPDVRLLECEHCSPARRATRNSGRRRSVLQQEQSGDDRRVRAGGLGYLPSATERAGREREIGLTRTDEFLGARLSMS
jgi:hypothetical protein